MPPPMMMVSAMFSRLLMTPILEETLLPPKMATRGRLGSAMAPPRNSSSFWIRKPETAGRYAATPAVEAWARCTAPKASDTYRSAMSASFLANSGSFLVSPGSKRVFSSSRICPGCRAAALVWASGPTTSWAKITSRPSSSLRRFATGARLSLGSGPFLGLPRWEQAMTAAPFSSRYWMVGSAATMRLSLVMAPVSLSWGTLKSQRSRAFLPRTSTSRTVFLWVFI